MGRIRRIARWLGCAMGLALWLVMAQSIPAFAQAESAPRVARLTFAEGYVRIDHHDNTAGDPAQLNMPLIEGQTVITGEDGQAEVEFEDGSVARVTPNSALLLAQLTVASAGSASTQLALLKGLAYFELRAASQFTYRVDAVGDQIVPVENTTFRVNLDEPPAAIAVLDGTTHVERGDGYKVDVHAGETLRNDATSTGRYFLTQEIAPDSWDQWNESRDQAAADTAPTQTAARDGYAGSQGYGWSDLDANGSWYDVPGQGQVWQPTGGDAADFDPYGNGSWVYYGGGGYLWASSYSWGWTPFRCGGWSYWDTFGWGWTPNAGCGGFGFAGGGFGYGHGGYINIILPPHRYPIHHPPGGGPGGGVHPIIHVHDTPLVPSGLRPIGPRRIAGVDVTPLHPIGQSYTSRGGSVIGASLRRDFPVDRSTHTPVLGVPPTHGAVQSGFVNNGVPVNGRTGVARPILRPGQPQGSRPPSQPGLRPSGPPPPGNYSRPAGPPPSRPMPAPHVSAPSAPRPSSPPPAPHPAPTGGARK